MDDNYYKERLAIMDRFIAIGKAVDKAYEKGFLLLDIEEERTQLVLDYPLEHELIPFENVDELLEWAKEEE